MPMMSTVAREAVEMHAVPLIVRIAASSRVEWGQTVLLGFACESACPAHSLPGYQGSLAGLLPRQQLSSRARVSVRQLCQLLQRRLCPPISDYQSLSVYRVVTVSLLLSMLSACRRLRLSPRLSSTVQLFDRCFQSAVPGSPG